MLVWNCVLTWLVLEKPAARDANGDITENVVVDYSNDLSEMAEDIRSSIVTVETRISGLRHVSSGVIFAKENKDVYVFTSEQSGYDDSGIHVIFDSSASVEAELVASDPESAVSLLKCTPAFDVSVIRSGNSSLLRQGEYAAAMGGRSSVSQSAPMSYGIISRPGQKRITAGSDWFSSTIDIDANVTSDMVGGPVLNIGGELIGILVSRTFGGDRMGSALSVDEMKILFEEFKKEGKASRGSLGCTWRTVSGMRAYEKSERNIKLDVTSGVLITYIAEDSPAEEILEEGDILLAMDGIEISDESDLMQMLYEHLPGDEAFLSILRGSETMEVSVSLQ